MTASIENILEVEDLIVDLPRGAENRQILKGVSFSVRRGEFVALVGESGSGKTTLSHSIIGMLAHGLRPRSGHVRFSGQDLLALGDRQFSQILGKDIGFIPQDPAASLNPVKTIGFQLSEIFRLRPKEFKRGSVIRSKCVELLKQVGVDRPEERLRQYPHQLSGGLKQRVLIAIAFGLRPKLLIADEPTSALDVTVQKQIMTIFAELAEEHHAAVIFVTHDIALASDHASRVLVMREGKVVEDAGVDSILQHPADRYTQLLVHNARAAFGKIETSLPLKGHAFSESGEFENIIEVENLVKIYGDDGFIFRNRDKFTAVSGVSFKVRRGSTFALLGESGSGKSTTARTIIGLETATSGAIRLNGRDITQVRGRRRKEIWRDIQLVYQNPNSSLNPRETVGEIIVSPLRAHGVGSRTSRTARVVELLDQVGLPRSVFQKVARELSGGQSQRVAIARALALSAKVIILDEALSGLDVVTRSQVLALLKRVQRELALTFIFISHDLSVVRSFADDVGVMQQGHLVEAGKTDDIFERPRTSYTRALLDALPGAKLNRPPALFGPLA